MAERPADAGVAIVPAWVTAALGPDLDDAARAPWGFTNETWGATTPAGHRYAVTRMASPAACAFVLRAGPEIARRVAAVGLGMPVPIAESSSAADGIVVSAWVEGKPAMQRLSGLSGAEAVGRVIGSVWRLLRNVDIEGLDLDATWADPPQLAKAAARWLTAAEDRLSPKAAAGAATAIEIVAAQPPLPRRSFVHGDLVPANVLIRDNGASLLDLEAARIGDPLLDAAWFRWIVGFHHPELLAAAWTGFGTAAGLADQDPAQAAALDEYPVIRILEILAGNDLPAAARDRWLEQLESAAVRVAT